ncbi:glycerol-3-phosphate acyltransferase [Oxobacter pfennigii]|uniref:Glycerol-3-phosphate acyltransferase n=1 Tax=Oxobacter pfennigii TaxID=36849 RepID=A0A0P8WUE6_9CLOT|nr:glycerol-3-phosphate 1-O-acyltransferase PlsY [Oxobacter pfennigii]KPU46334.1 glycerol-3-phosphate acyltransferase [Oxobacter pfennigii]
MNVLAILAGYLFGCFQTSYIISKVIKKSDIRDTGSKNAGTSNMVMTFGWKLGFMTFLGDIFKIIIPMAIAKYYFNTSPMLNLLLGLGAILGHNFPFYMNFKGGKGTATTLGMLLILDYRICIAISLILVILALITNYIALASMIAIALLPLALYILKYDLNIVLISIFIPMLSVYVHRRNIKDMLSKKEKKISSVFKKKKN